MVQGGRGGWTKLASLADLCASQLQHGRDLQGGRGELTKPTSLAGLCESLEQYHLYEKVCARATQCMSKTPKEPNKHQKGGAPQQPSLINKHDGLEVFS